MNNSLGYVQTLIANSLVESGVFLFDKVELGDFWRNSVRTLKSIGFNINAIVIKNFSKVLIYYLKEKHAAYLALEKEVKGKINAHELKRYRIAILGGRY